MIFHRVARRSFFSAAIGICAIILLAALLAATIGLKSNASSSQVAFSQSVNISNDNNTAQYPWVAAYGNYVYIVWTEQSHGIWFRASPDNGSNWDPTIKLSITSGHPSHPLHGTSNYPVMIANGSNVYVVWTQVYLGNGTIEFASSTNYGASFSAPQALSHNNINADIPYIANYGANIYSIWHQVTPSGNQSVWAASSNNNGSTWTSPKQLDDRAGLAGAPQIAAYGNYSYATWNGGGAWFSESNNSGSTWSTPVNLDSNLTQFILSPWVAASGPNVYVTWNDNDSGTGYEPYIAVSNNYGAAFSNRTSLLPSGTNDYQVQIAASGNDSYVVFRDHSHNIFGSRNGDVFFKFSNDSGLTWTNYYPTPSGSLQNGTQGITGWADGVAQSGSTVGFAYLSGCSTGQYEPFPNSGNGDCNVYASYSNDSGTSFSQTQLTSDYLAGPIRQISTTNFAIFGSNMYVAWQDNQTGNFQIYFSGTGQGTITTTTTSSTSSSTSPDSTTSTSTIVLTSSSTSSPSSSVTSFTSTVSTTSSSSITSTSTSTIKTSSGSNFDLYAGVAAIIAAVVVASAVLMYRRNRARPRASSSPSA